MSAVINGNESLFLPKLRVCGVLVTLFFGALASPAFARAKINTWGSSVSSYEQDFPTDPFVRRQVRFWEAVFQKYRSNSVVIHDLDDPLAMIDVIDFENYVTGDGKVTSIEDSDQTNLVKRYIDRYNIGVERFAKYKDGALKFGAIERRLFEVYNREPQLLSRLYAGSIRFRGQGGLADTFMAAAQRAQRYLPYMEQTFKQYGLPVVLTRLPFVESMFNLSAKSKVGASGIWQFMPDTAREYMYVGSLVDERNNPYKATHGAARLFMANYGELKSWPLAVTAYNHGRGGMNRASKELGTTQLGAIINGYRSPTFGFASKNFYAEFLAAARTYEQLAKNNLINPAQAEMPTEHVVLTRPLSIKQIMEATNISRDQLGRLNPCITTYALSSKSHLTLPKNYKLRLPKQESRILQRRYAVAINKHASSSQVSRR